MGRGDESLGSECVTTSLSKNLSQTESASEDARFVAWMNLYLSKDAADVWALEAVISNPDPVRKIFSHGFCLTFTKSVP